MAVPNSCDPCGCIGANIQDDYFKQAVLVLLCSISETGGLPDQAGHAGQFLTTNGTVASWAAVSAGGDMFKATYDPANVNQQLLGISAIQVITNKTIDADLNTLSNIENADIKAAAAIALNKLAATTVSRALVSDGSGFITAATTTAAEIGFVNGVTSSIQTQINSKQAGDATLTALAAYNTNGLMTQTAADTFTGRTLTGTGSVVVVTNGDGVSGNPTISLDATLTALAAFNTNGLLTQTAADTFTGRTITGTGSVVVVTNGDGVSGNPTISLDATLTALAAFNTNGILTQTAADTFTGRTITGTANEITVTNGDGVSGNPTLSLASNARVESVGATKDGQGVAVTTGTFHGYRTVPFAGTITAWNIGVDTGTATIKVWKIATGTAVPTVANVINTSGVALSSGTYVRSTTVSDFTTTTVAANDIFVFNIEAVSGATQITFQLEITKS